MNHNLLKNLVTIFVFLCFLTVGALFPIQVQAQDQKGDVTYASVYGAFYQVGGDPATHVAGAGPLTANTVFEGLVDCGKNLEMLPAAAESWKIAPDWSHIDFFIKKGIKFHNNDPLTAEDVKFSFAKHMDPKMRQVLGVDYRKRIKDIEVISPYQARFNLNMPAPDLLPRFWWDGAIMPKKYREAVGDKGFADKPIGSGPFRWVEYKQDQYYKLESLPEHHRQTPQFKTLKIVYVVDPSTRLAMLKAGEADIIELSGAHIPAVKSDPNLRFFQNKHVFGSGLQYCDLVHPEKPSPFHDIKVRKAVSMAIDRKTICEKILFGAAEPWGEVLCPYNLGFDPSVKPDPYDPEKAKALLAEAGYADGFETELNIRRDKLIMEAIAANLADVGIKAKLTVFEGGAWYEAHRSKTLTGLKIGPFWYSAEPHPGADIQNSFNTDAPFAYSIDKEIEKMLDDSMAARTDEEAAEWGRKLSKAIRDKYMRPPLWSQHANYGLSKKIVKWEPQVGSFPGTRFEYMTIKP
jgi:peptide/nickel transport system substrate-binding protein